MAQGWRERIVAGQIYSIQQLASGAKLNFRYAARIFRLATLSPEIVDAMVDQGSMADQPLSHFIAGLLLDWRDQGSRLRQMTSKSPQMLREPNPHGEIPHWMQTPSLGNPLTSQAHTANVSACQGRILRCLGGESDA